MKSLYAFLEKNYNLAGNSLPPAREGGRRPVEGYLNKFASLSKEKLKIKAVRIFDILDRRPDVLELDLFVQI